MNEKILNGLQHIRQLIAHYQAQTEKTELYSATRFNPFQFMKTDETGLSQIIAFLLSPKETHGQSDLFLNSFIKCIERPQFLAYDNVIVTTEENTVQSRRIDIVIEGYLEGKLVWIIAIENKLRGASDQPAQLKDYAADLERRKVPFCLIYLPIYGENPSNESIEEQEWEMLVDQQKGKTMSANEIIEWLDKTPIIAPSVQSFCQDFKRFLTENIMGKTETSEHLIEELLKIENNELLFSAITVINAKEALFEKLLDQLKIQIDDYFKQNYQTLHHKGWIFDIDLYGSNNSPCLFFNTQDDKWGLCVEFGARNAQSAYYGIYIRKDELNEEYYLNLKSVFETELSQNGFKANKHGLGWKYLPNHLLNWNADVWMKIPSGELAKELLKLFSPLLDEIEKNIDILSDV